MELEIFFSSKISGVRGWRSWGRRFSEMAQQIKVLADDLSLNPGTHKIEERNSQNLFSDFHMDVMV